jgi:hypothetical protein
VAARFGQEPHPGHDSPRRERETSTFTSRSLAYRHHGNPVLDVHFARSPAYDHWAVTGRGALRHR